jgi:hypothetical protein
MPAIADSAGSESPFRPWLLALVAFAAVGFAGAVPRALPSGSFGRAIATRRFELGFGSLAGLLGIAVGIGCAILLGGA